jgi:uncharacterized repeat protein (TIGR01451 family)
LGTPLAGTGASITVTPSLSTTYWVRGKGTGVCSAYNTSCTTIALGVINCTDLDLRKTATPQDVCEGEDITFKLIVKNNGVVAVAGIIVTDTLPPTLTYDSHIATAGTFSNPLWTVGNLAVGDSAILTITTTSTTAGNGILNRAYVSAAGGTTYNSYANAVTKSSVLVNVHAAPPIPTEDAIQYFCAGDIVGDLLPKGSNITWYDNLGNVIPKNTPLECCETYYGTQTSIYGCESDYLEVTVQGKTPKPTGPLNVGLFCTNGTITVADLIAKLTGTGIKIYKANDLTTPLPTTEPLSSGTYYATSTVSGCESMGMLEINVVIYPPANVYITLNPTAGVLDDTTTNIVLTANGGTTYAWEYYNTLLGGRTQVGTSSSYNASAGGIYTLTATNANGCTGKDSVEITVRILGTVFPFVKWSGSGMNAFNEQFEIMVRLRPVPETKPTTASLVLLKSTNSMYYFKVLYYDGSTFIDQTPNYGGFVGGVYNFNYAGISWNQWVNWPKFVYPAPYLMQGFEAPIHQGTTVGFYNIPALPGNYIIEIDRKGFVTRWGEVLVNVSGTHKEPHRELIPGDLDELDLEITDLDALLMLSKIGGVYGIPGTNYDPLFDLNADGKVDQLDYNIVLKFKLFKYINYIETDDWLK